MKVSQFKDALDELAATNSRNEKKEIIAGVSDSPAAISFLSGSEFDNAGLGKKTVLGVAQDVFGDDIDGKPTVSESLESEDSLVHHGYELSMLHGDMQRLAELSGNDQKDCLEEMFEFHEYPSVVAHACLNDWPTGCGNSTIAKAMGVKDSLPFYDGVHEIAAADEPLTEPEVGSAFKPMTAKSESSLPDSLDRWWGQPKLDGYRILIHIKAEETGQTAYAFSRRMNDVTESLPELQEIDWPAGEYVLDGEVIAEDGTYKSTSERVGRKSDNVEREVEMEFGLFDIIIHAGTNVSSEPYRKRYKHLDSAAISISDNRVGVLPIIEDVDEARKVGRNYEGLIWKDPDAPYKFDKRSKGWVKEKNTAETVDVVATEFFEGEGRLDGTLGKVSIESSGGVPLGKTGSGFSDDERDEVWENQEDYLGEPLEVEAEAFDDGLRFPIFQRWRVDDGEPDSIERIQKVLPSP